MFVSFIKTIGETAELGCVFACAQTCGAQLLMTVGARGQRLDPRFTMSCHVSALTDAVVTLLSTALCDTCRIMSFVYWRMFIFIIFNSFVLSSLSFCVTSAHYCPLTCPFKNSSLLFCTRLAFVTTSHQIVCCLCYWRYSLPGFWL